MLMVVRLYYRGFMQVGDPIGITGKAHATQQWACWIFNVGYVVFMCVWFAISVRCWHEWFRKRQSTHASLRGAQ